jgi:hypothetical protein
VPDNDRIKGYVCTSVFVFGGFFFTVLCMYKHEVYIATKELERILNSLRLAVNMETSQRKETDHLIMAVFSGGGHNHIKKSCTAAI